MDTQQTECKRCGICCEIGGPALHKKDRSLITQKIHTLEKLITVRKGELVIKPHNRIPEPAACELIKIAGAKGSWQCGYYNKKLGCTIYEKRPSACVMLECWNTSAVEEIVEKETLNRFDIIDPDDPLRTKVEEHNEKCPVPDLLAVVPAIQKQDSIVLLDLEALINEDIQLRNKAVEEFNLSVAGELFYFGRPLFQMLQQVGFQVSEIRGRLTLGYPHLEK